MKTLLSTSFKKVIHFSFASIILLGCSAVIQAEEKTAPPAKYAASCAACHSNDAVGAPKTGDAAAWAPRLKKGNDALLTSVKNGLGVMPAGGMCADCTDAEYLELIKFMSTPAE
ncbi:MAG: c-type cytochrome [Pseudomonadota bacterium]